MLQLQLPWLRRARTKPELAAHRHGTTVEPWNEDEPAWMKRLRRRHSPGKARRKGKRS